MSNFRRKSFFIRQKILSNQKAYKERNSFMSKDTKGKKITFQLIDDDKVEINPNFWMPPEIISIIKNNNGNYNPSSKVYEIPFKKYPTLYNNIESLLNNQDFTKIIEYKNINLDPIPILPIEVSQKAKDISIIKFKSEKTTNSKKKSLIQITLDFTKDEKKTLNLLPEKFLSYLYEFQKEGIAFGAEKKGRILLADEMGVGKSIQAIGISLLYKEDWPVLIICPSSLKYVWRDEILKWIPDINDNKMNIQILKTGKDEFKFGLHFYIMSYDLSTKLEDRIINKNFKFIIADEAHYLKSTDAKRTKCLLPIIQKSKRILLLTGTPILSRPVELYPLLQMLRPDLFHNFKIFGNRYCNPKVTFYGTDWTGSSCAKELNYILNNIMIRRLKKDVMTQLPPKKRQKVEIQTDPKIIKQICAINFSSEEIFQKLGELNSANIYSNDGLIKYQINEEGDIEDKGEHILNVFNKVYMLSAEAKVQGVKEYIHYLIDNKCKFLIFAHHQIMLDAIEEEVKKLKVDYIRIDGKVKVDKRQENVNKFQNDETCLVAILSITACYTGITLTKASTVVFSELHMTPAVMIQAEDRAHRIGQEHECVNIHYLYGPSTLDEVLFKMLNQKQNIFSNTLDNTSKNMEVKNIYKKVGDFEKGRIDLDVNIENKKCTITHSGIKNQTLNNFIKTGNSNNKNIKMDIKDINFHKSQIRKIKNTSSDENDSKDENLEVPSLTIDGETMDEQTKDKKLSNVKKKAINKVENKLMFKSIYDFFK